VSRRKSQVIGAKFDALSFKIIIVFIGGYVVLEIHGIVRWIVVVVAVVTIVKLALGLIQKSKFTQLDRTLTMLFSIGVDIQVLLGIITLVTLGINRERIEHAFMMILALVAVHLPMRWRNATDEVRFRNTLISFVLALVFIVVGVALLSGGWGR
jgi:hypothetical protein